MEGTSGRRRPEEQYATGIMMLTDHGDLLRVGAVPPSARILESTWVGIALAWDSPAWWALTDRGSVEGFDGPSGEVPATRPVIGIAPYRSTGWWVADDVGGIFCGGHAPLFGSVPGVRTDAPAIKAIGVASTPTGWGYWIFDSDGGVFAFGDAQFFGSVPGLRSSATPPISTFAVTPAAAGTGSSARTGPASGSVTPTRGGCLPLDSRVRLLQQSRPRAAG